MPEKIVHQGTCPDCGGLCELKWDGEHWVTLPHGDCAGGKHTQRIHKTDGLGEAEGVRVPLVD